MHQNRDVGSMLEWSPAICSSLSSSSLSSSSSSFSLSARSFCFSHKEKALSQNPLGKSRKDRIEMIKEEKKEEKKKIKEAKKEQETGEQSRKDLI